MNRVLSIYLVFLSWLCYGQQYQIQSYTIEDGLPQSQVYDIIQDDIGYLWTATQGGGLGQFDGAAFKIWTESEGLLSNYINALLWDAGTLYIGTQHGLSIKTGNTFKNFPSKAISNIYKVENGLLLGTNQGLQYFDNETIASIEFKNIVDQTTINDMLFDGQWYWFATDKGLWRGKNIFSKTPAMELIHDAIFKVVTAIGDKIVAGSFTQGIFTMDAAGRLENPIDVDRINALKVINDELWVATFDDGVYVYTTETLTLNKNITTANGLMVNHVRQCILDKQSNIWIATSGGGISKFFENNFKHYDKETGLNGNRIYALHHTNDIIWASNSEKGIVKIDSLGIHNLSLANDYLNVKVKTMAQDEQNRLWFGTDGKGILTYQEKEVLKIKIDTSDSETITYDTLRQTIVLQDTLSKSDRFPFNWIRKIVVHENQIWVASYSSGIANFQYNGATKTIEHLKIYGKSEGLKDIFINDMVYHDGKIWFATRNGTIGYIENETVVNYENVLQRNTAIRTLLFNKETLFLGTSGKGIWYSSTTDSLHFQKLKGNRSLTSENIYQLIFDDTNQLWAGSENGLDKILLNQANEIIDVIHLGKSDGYLGIEACLNAVTKDSKGNLWFGALYGLTKYTPFTNEKNNRKPHLHFENIEVVYKSLDSINYDEWSNSQRVLRLKDKENHVSFQYRTIDINHPKEVEYRYKLDGSQWSKWSTDQKVNLVGLAYDDHIFTAQSRDIYWNESDPISFKLHIIRPLIKKTWFKNTLYLLAILLFAATLAFYWYRYKQKTKEALEKLQVQNHLLNLEQKALRLQMNPHFIFNVLNGIKAMSTYDTKKMHTVLNKFATLLRGTLLNSRQDQVSLKEEIKSLKDYIEVEQLMSQKPFTYGIETVLDIDPEEIQIPPMLIQPFVENAIRHGILATNNAGILKIVFKTDDHFLYTTVTDNGIGINLALEQKTQTDHQSVALKVTKERVASIGGEIAITDLGQESADAVSGTKIALKIPLITDF